MSAQPGLSTLTTAHQIADYVSVLVKVNSLPVLFNGVIE